MEFRANIEKIPIDSYHEFSPMIFYLKLIFLIKEWFLRMNIDVEF